VVQEFEVVVRLYQRNSGFKGIHLYWRTTTTSNSDEVIKDTLKGGGMGYIHSCSRLKCIGESMFM
jgi:hypothetical protein